MTITLVSTSINGTAANSANYEPALSADGRYVAFQTHANNLFPGGTFLGGIVRKDLVTGEVLSMSAGGAGVQANGDSFGADISADGRYVVFDSNAGNLATGDANGASDVFRKDSATGEVVLVSSSTADTQGNGASTGSAVSADGRYVAFTSAADNLVAGDTNGTSDVFRKDLATGEVVLASSSSVGAQGNGFSSGCDISADGRYVLFASDAGNLVPGGSFMSGDLFRKDLATGETMLVSSSSAGASGNGFGLGSARLSADGRYAVFSDSSSNLAAGDTNGSYDIFRKDLATGETVVVSAAGNGTLGNGNSFAPSISADGRYVLFESGASNLVAGDTNNAEDVFRKDLATGEITLVSAAVGGSAPGNGNSLAPSISADGRYAAFASAAGNLVAGDANSAQDIFLNDLGGGSTPPATPPVHIVAGTSGADRLSGTAGDDTINAFGGNDTILASAGADAIDGSSGFDTVVFGIGFRGAAVAANADGSVDLTTSLGAAHLVGIEQAAFADGRLVFDAADPAAKVARLYGAALDRAPDQGGLNYWIDAVQHGHALSELSQGFIASPEFQARFGGSTAGDGAFVDQLYHNVLGRDGEAGGRAFWVDALGRGAGRADVLTAFSESDENKAGTAALVQAGIWDRSEAAGEVARLYDTVFGRLPDAPGLASWKAALEGGAVTLAQVANGFTASAEFRTQYGSLDNRRFAEALYANSLDRAADEAGLDYWTGRLDAGMARSAVVLAFSESAEHVGNTQDAVQSENAARYGVTFA